MQTRYAILLFSCFALLMVSCKNDKKKKDAETVTTLKTEKPKIDVPKKKVRTAADRERSNSVMARLMVTPDTKKFTSFVVTTGLADLLKDQKGPFTVFAPANAVFEAMDADEKKFYLNPDNLEHLKALIKTHIVEGDFDSATMVQEIHKKGKLKLKTLNNETLTATKKGMDIIITDPKGQKAVMQKSDILGSNGVVHVLDAILNQKDGNGKK